MCSAETPSWQGLGLGEPCCVDILRGGRNSRVFGLTLDHGNRAAVKQYFRHPGDPRDRMGTEAAALRLMHGAGLACVPGLLGQDPEQGLTCLEFIDGTPSGPARPSDMDQAADLLLRLKDLAKSAQPGSAAMGLGPASEAFFSADDVVQNLRQRLARLEAAPQDAPLARELQDFLRGSLAPALERSVDRCASQLAPRTMQTVLPQDERTLSPSDFGLHNALRRADGSLVFLDFEYFGWDDPAKTLCDFALHPAMNLDDALLARFLNLVLPGLGGTLLAARAKALYPLFRLKWALILLNEFLPRDAARRSFAGSATDQERLQAQLVTSAAMVAGLDAGQARFSALLD